MHWRTLLAGLAGCGWCLSFVPPANKACDPADTAWKPYTGFRIQREVNVGASKTGIRYDHAMVIVECRYGKVVSETRASLPWDHDVIWNETVSNGVRLARRKKFAKRTSSLYLPTTTVGGLFNCTAQCEPILPLISDKIYEHWSFVRKGQICHRLPYLYTPDVLDREYPQKSGNWARMIQPDEVYPGPRKNPPPVYRQLDKVCQWLYSSDFVPLLATPRSLLMHLYAIFR